MPLQMVQLLRIRKGKLFLLLLLIAGISCVNAQQYPGTNLRGQIETFNAYYNNYYSLPNSVIDLYYSPSPNQFVFIAETITNVYGFYFFYSIQPGNGMFFIQVNKAKNYQIFVSQMNYYNNQYNYNQFQDVPILYY
jgi:hypothetical protein